MNETLLVLTAIFSAVFVLIGWRLGKDRLYSVIIVFLILIATVGGKVVVFFGHSTNTGNIFYASVFLATYFLIERYGRREGIYSILVGIIAVLFFSLLARLTVSYAGAEVTGPLSNALSIVFTSVPRIAFASLVAYALSQTVNVYLYLLLKTRTGIKNLWLRANIANVFAQIIDSMVFFSIAFWGVVFTEQIADIILTGFVIKVVYMMLVSPLLYLNDVQQEEGWEGSSTITLS